MSSKEFAAALCGTSMSTLPAAAFVRYAMIRTGLAFNCQRIISITVIRYADESVTASALTPFVDENLWSG